MKRYLLIIIFVTSVTILFAQNKTDSTYTRPVNNFNLNFAGEGSFVSINYERLFLINPVFFLTGQIGFGYNEEFLIWGGPPETFRTIPHHITGNWGKRKHFFEFGLSGAIILGNTNNHYLLGPIIGYRIQPLKTNKVNFRIYASIPVIIGLNTETFSYAGISFGYCF